ncbi:MAG: tol-pal system protein YbgF [Gammaproteobacteria bacterium]|nr:MAG: tol-pal system protein YbgF [Gammaproteobacteria bacterium]
MERKLRMKCKLFGSRLLVTLVLMQVSTMAAAHKANNERLDTMDARMQRVERVANSEALVNLSQRINVLQREIQQLRGENEQLTHELNTLKSRQREQYLDIDRRLQASGPVSMSDSRSASEGVLLDNNAANQVQTSGDINNSNHQVATTSGTIVSNSASNDAAQDYKTAFTLLKQGKYDDSIVAFNGFLQTHSQSKYASNAQYWLAEANYVSKRYPQALSEFTKVIEQYPASSKVADAKLKLGFTHYELGQYEESRIELTRLRAQFPNSSVASLAQQRLDRMAREGH